MPRSDETFQQIRDDRRTQILEVAKQMILEKGLSSIKISDIAKTVGMSQGLFYRYFPSKEDVLITIIEEATTELKEKASIISQLKGNSYEVLFGLTEHLIENFHENPKRNQLIRHGLAYPGKAQDLANEASTLLQKQIYEIIVKGQNDGSIVKVEPMKLVVIYLSLMQGLASSLYFFKDYTDSNFPDIDTILRTFKA